MEGFEHHGIGAAIQQLAQSVETVASKGADDGRRWAIEGADQFQLDWLQRNRGWLMHGLTDFLGRNAEDDCPCCWLKSRLPGDGDSLHGFWDDTVMDDGSFVALVVYFEGFFGAAGEFGEDDDEPNEEEHDEQ